ncbi:MAG: S8 family serine peptidase [Candidatus Daviesbacteria bacterium]|nr:S8 family serine peptidase [Candidatus Daviesbacteria bacterium]
MLTSKILSVNNQRGFAPILILLAALGIILFLLISSTAPFKDRLFNTLFPKPPSHAEEQPPSVADEILLKFKAGVPDQAKEKIRNEHRLKKQDEIEQIGVERVKVPSDKKDQILEALKHNPQVKYAEANFIAKLDDEPNDPAYVSGAEWHLKKIQASPAWDITKGSVSAIVAVIDSGVFAGHEDLGEQLVPGFNFTTNTTDTSDVNGHGTMVTGVITALTNNAKGVASLGRTSPVMPLRIVGTDGSLTYYALAQAITYAADHQAKVVNMSLGGTAISSTVQSSINYAWNKGLVLVAAPGNSGTAGIEFPASGTNVVAVGATDSNDQKASFSNTGTELDVVAPGQNIYTTTSSGSYIGANGTSFSSPLVAALAALIFSANPSLTNQQVVDIITQTTDDLGTVGWDDQYGWGIINACKALKAAVPTSAINCNNTSSPTPTSSPSPSPSPTPDTTLPTVNITSPSSGSTVSGSSVSFNVDASDNIGVIKVEFYVDNILLPNGTESSAPYTAAWDTTTYSNSSHSLTAKAYDLAGNIASSATISVTVNNPISTPTPTPVPTSTPAPISSDITPPSVSITSPLNGATVKAASKVNVSAAATDNVKIAKVEFYVGSSLKCTSTLSAGPYSCTWPVPGKKNTSYIITVKAYDAINPPAQATITVKAQ